MDFDLFGEVLHATICGLPPKTALNEFNSSVKFQMDV